MVWKIFRPQFWQLDRRVRSANRLVMAVVVLLLGFGGQWAWDNLIRDKLSLLGSDTAVTLFAPMLANVLMLFLFIGIIGMGDVMRLLYQSADLELLLVAPLPLRTIFVVKLAQCSRVTLLPAIVLALLLAAFGVAQGMGAAFYGLALLLLLAGMVLVTAVIMSIVLALARLIPARRVNVWLPIAASLLAVLVVWGQQWLTNWFVRQEVLLRWLADALRDVAQLMQLTLALAGAAVLAAGGAYLIFARAFYDGWSHLREVTARPRQAASRQMGWWLRPFPLQVRPFVRSEWLLLRRDPSRLINLALAMLPVLMMFLPLLGSSRVAELRPLIFWLLLAMGLFISVTSLSAETIPAVGRDGGRAALWRAAPISVRAVLAGKFWGNAWPLAWLLWMLFFALAGWYFGFAGWQVAVLVTAVSWQIIIGAALLLPFGALTADLQAEDSAKSVSGLSSLLALTLHGLFALLNLGTAVCLLVHWRPESELLLPLQALTGFSPVGWLLTEGSTAVMVLAGGQLVALGLVALFWRAAERKLENNEL